MLETENDAKKVLDMVYHNGKVEGQKGILELNSILLKDKRYDDLEKATNDQEYRNQLLEQYKLL